MKKKDIKELFKEIRNQNNSIVKELIQNNIDLVNVCNFAPPKKDDGQSPLQVSFKISNLEIAQFLISKGANINFKEEEAEGRWTAPVIQDCVRCCINQTIFYPTDPSQFSKAFDLLQKMLKMGANPNIPDSRGTSSLMVAFLATREAIMHPMFKDYSQFMLKSSRLVFKELIKFNADLDYKKEGRGTLEDLINSYGYEKYNLIEKTPHNTSVISKAFGKLFGSK